MKTLRITAAAIACLVCLVCFAQAGLAHEIYLKKNPTNENGIEFGVNNAAGYVSWRAYVNSAAGKGLNTGWKDAGNNWYYYELDNINQRVMWRLGGMENSKLLITYWVFKADGSWDYGPQAEVVSDTEKPFAWFDNLAENTNINDDQINIEVKTTDNLSGVAAFRIYTTLPQFHEMPGWIPSGLQNEFYKEFSSKSGILNFTAPVAGKYRFTLWVKDNAGNIHYEPGGEYFIVFNFEGSDPLPDFVPEAPTNLQLNTEGKKVIITWQDNADNELGYYIYEAVKGQVGQVAANQTKFTDTNVEYGKTYAYSVVAYNDQYSSLAATKIITMDLPPADDPDEINQYADSFTWPMDCNAVYRTEPDSDHIAGSCYDAQPFGTFNSDWNKVHLGADFNYVMLNDLGAPLIAIANATVWDFGYTNGSWGGYVILKIEAQPGKKFFLSDGSQVSAVYAFYGHVDQIFIKTDKGDKINFDQIIKKQTQVKKGWQIGTVGDGNGAWFPHLHFEIRKHDTGLGSGYLAFGSEDLTKYYTDPLEFIENNWFVDSNENKTIYVHSYDTFSGQKTFTSFDKAKWSFQERLYYNERMSLGWNNGIYLEKSSEDSGFTWHFQIPWDGQWSVYAVIPRYYAQGTNVQYDIWHESNDQDIPKKVFIDQKNNDINKEAYLGTFDFWRDKFYQVDLHSKTNDNPAVDIAADAVIVVYEGELGSGGGVEEGQKRSITSDGTLPFEYQGSSQCPLCSCDGPGNPWPTQVIGDCQHSSVLEIPQSGTYRCNCQLDNGSWVGEWYGLKEDEHLFVGGYDIRYWEDNGNGGSNFVFDVVLDSQGSDPNPDIDPPHQFCEIQTFYGDDDQNKLEIRYQGIYYDIMMMCGGAGSSWPYVVVDSNVFRSGYMPVRESGEIYCNIFYPSDESWMGEWYGLRPGEHIFVNDQEICHWKDNNNGGSNAVFKVIYDPPESSDPNDPPGYNDPDPDPDPGNDNPPGSGGYDPLEPVVPITDDPIVDHYIDDQIDSGAGSGGCTMCNSMDPVSAWFNLFLMICPGLFLAGRKWFFKLI